MRVALFLPIRFLQMPSFWHDIWLVLMLNRISRSPRWLVESKQVERAKSTLRWLREGNYSDREIDLEFVSIVKNVDAYYASGTSWLSLFREPALLARLWRATALQFMATLCGATAMKYYLPTLLEALGLETRVALMAGAVEMTIKIGFTVLEMFLIDRFGRRNCLVAGCAVMAAAMLVGRHRAARTCCFRCPSEGLGSQEMSRSTAPCPWRTPTTRARSPT